jgi:hypothetical protein
MVATALPDLDQLEVEALKELVIAQCERLDSHAQQIEHLKLVIEKLRRMMLVPRARRSQSSLSNSNCSWKRRRLRSPPMKQVQSSLRQKPSPSPDHLGSRLPPIGLLWRAIARRVERTRRFGGPWLGWTLLRQLELDRFLDENLSRGREQVPWPLVAMVLVLGRLCDPSSELHLAESYYEHSALADLLGVPAEKVNDDRLYRALDARLPHKLELEQHLRNKLGELFDLDYDLLLYDVTSTYFEGEAKGNPLAQRGYSRDHRGDCKQVNLSLVVSRCGMPVGYEVGSSTR